MATTGPGKAKSTKRNATRATTANAKRAKSGSPSVTVSSRAGGTRALMNTGTGRQFVRAGGSGRFTESDNVGRGASAGPRHSAKASAKPGRAGERKAVTRGTANSTVPEILQQIDNLSMADRVVLERRLAERSEAEWLREARAAQGLARARGIDQAAIDRAVQEVRYPQPRNGRRG